MFLIDELTDKPIIISEVAEALTQLYTDGALRDLISELFRNTDIKPAEFLGYWETLDHLKSHPGWTEDLTGVDTKSLVQLLATNDTDEDLLAYHLNYTSGLNVETLSNSLNYYVNN